MSRSINECVKRKKILIICSSFHHIEFIILYPSEFGTEPDANTELTAYAPNQHK